MSEFFSLMVVLIKIYIAWCIFAVVIVIGVAVYQVYHYNKNNNMEDR